MKAWQITGTLGFESLHLLEVPSPQPASGEVLVKIHACSLNYRDYMNVTGIRGITGPIPRVPCSDGAGEIVALGEEVSSWKVGQRVVIPFMPTWLDGSFTALHAGAALGGAVDGLLREYACLPAHSLIEIPPGYSYAQAATLPCAALTAWDALFERAQLQANETVLILGSGGVSVFALQMAVKAQARVLAITSCDKKAEKLRTLGAHAVCNYRTQADWEEWVLAQTNGIGVDQVIEIGGPETLNRSIKATRFGGRIALIGVLTGTAGEIQTVGILRKGIRLDGIYVGSRAMFTRMLTFIQEEALEPVIDRVYPFSKSVEAFRFMESGQHFGKIVVQVCED